MVLYDVVLSVPLVEGSNPFGPIFFGSEGLEIFHFHYLRAHFLFFIGNFAKISNSSDR